MLVSSEDGTVVVWRGNNMMPHTHGMDVISQHYIEAQGLHFIDVNGIMEHFKSDIDNGRNLPSRRLWNALASLPQLAYMCRLSLLGK